MFFVGLITGILIGNIAGVLLVSLLAAAKTADLYSEIAHLRELSAPAGKPQK